MLRGFRRVESGCGPGFWGEGQVAVGGSCALAGRPCLVQVVTEVAQLAAALDGEGRLGHFAHRVWPQHHREHVGGGACGKEGTESPLPGDRLSGCPSSVRPPPP